MDWIIPLLIGIVLTIVLGSLLYKPVPAPVPQVVDKKDDVVVYPYNFPYMTYYFNQYPYRPYYSGWNRIGPAWPNKGHLIGPDGCLGGRCRGSGGGKRGRLN